MADLLTITETALAIIEERFMAWYDALLMEEQDSSSSSMPQATKRADFEQLASLSPGQFGQALSSFQQQYGGQEYGKQMHLSILRDRRENGRQG